MSHHVRTYLLRACAAERVDYADAFALRHTGEYARAEATAMRHRIIRRMVALAREKGVALTFNEVAQTLGVNRSQVRRALGIIDARGRRRCTRDVEPVVLPGVEE